MEASADLSRRIPWTTATALVVGGTVGVGIFVTTGGMAYSLASPALLFGVWAFMGASAFCGALCYGELSARYPQAGGGYVYLREAFGPGLAFLYGWKCLLVMDPGLTATLATALGSQAHVAAPWLSPKATAISAIVLVAAANMAGVRLAAGLGNVLAVAKVALIVLLVGWGFASGAGDSGRFFPFVERAAGAPALVPSLAGAIVSAFFAFGGWWEASKLAGEIRDPQRGLPRSLALGVAIITLLYVSVSAVFLYLVPRESGAAMGAFSARVGEILLGPGGGRIFAAIVAVSFWSTLFAFMTMAPRVYYAMGRDGVMPAAIGKLHPQTGAPVRAILVQTVLAVILVALGTFDTIMAYFVFVTVAFLGLTVVGLFRLRRTAPEGSFVTPFFPWTPALFLLSIVLVLALLLGGQPKETALGVVVAALGIPVYRFFVAKDRA
jgi:basic amino acid/polyamine antiporter, APA family